jgi:type I restriction enzyme, S subunit
MTAATMKMEAPLRHAKAYPAYKDSGVEWLGKIPAQWKISPLFTLARERSTRNVNGEEMNVLSLSYGRIVRRDISERFGLMPESFDTYQIVEPGNLVLRLTDLQNDKRSLRVGFVPERGVITSAYVALSIRSDLVPVYAAYLLHAYDVTKVFYAFGGGVRQTMKFEDLKWMPLLVPSAIEQYAIAAFLDRETARIDALVAKKERLIELLCERRAALIEGVVRGEVASPKTRLGYYVDLLPGYAFPSEEFSHDPEDVRLLRGVNISPDDIRWDDAVYWPASESIKFTAYQLREGDLVLGMDRPWISTGIRVAEITGNDVPSLLLQRVARMRARPGLSQKYLKLVLSSPQFRAYFEPILTGISVPHVSPEQILGFRLHLPSLIVQEAACQRVHAELAQIESMCDVLVKSMTHLRELRAATISAAVTGKIDVRKSAA